MVEMYNEFELYPSTQSKTSYIRQLQTNLREMSYLYDTVPAIAIDGVAGPETEAALKAFQEAVGLEPTGIADPVTWNILHKNFLDSKKNQVPPLAFAAFPSNQTVFETGDYHPGIYSVQHAFSTLNQNFTNFIEPDFNGTIDNLTSENIRELRRLSLLPDGTYIDRDLWNILTLMHNSLTRK